MGGIQTRFHFITQEQTVQKLHLLMEMTVKHAAHYVLCLCRKRRRPHLSRERVQSADESTGPRGGPITLEPGLRGGRPARDQKGQVIKEIH